MLKIQDIKRQDIQAGSGATSASQRIELVNRSLEAGEWDKAYQQLEAVIQDKPSPKDAGEQLLLTAGMVALKLENYPRAEDHFRQVLTIAPDNFDASYNLAIMEMAAGDYARAVSRMRSLVRRNPAHSGLYNDVGVLWYNLGRLGRAEVAFRKALQLEPNYSAARNNAMEMFLKTQRLERGDLFLKRQLADDRINDVSRAEIDRWQSIFGSCRENGATKLGNHPANPVTPKIEVRQRVGKIAFFGTQRTFITDIADHLGRDNQIKFFDGRDLNSLADLMRWADLAWFEWCDDMIIAASRLPRVCRTICRLHSYEAFTDMPDRVDWSKVDHLLFVNDNVRQLVSSRVKGLPPSSVIHNGVNMDRFKIPESKSYGKTIASVGYINYKKNPALLLYCFKKIHEYDPEYSLHIAGAHQDPRISLYFSHFLEKTGLPIQFDGWVEDMAQWYRDKDFVISTSLFESFHYSIAEGMASGLMPLVHNWYGAENLYPDKYTFMDPDECLSLLKRLEGKDRHALAAENRAVINSRYNLIDKVSEINALLLSIAGAAGQTGEES